MNDRAIFRILVLRRAHTHTYSGMYTKMNTLKLIFVGIIQYSDIDVKTTIIRKTCGL